MFGHEKDGKIRRLRRPDAVAVLFALCFETSDILEAI